MTHLISMGKLFLFVSINLGLFVSLNGCGKKDLGEKDGAIAPSVPPGAFGTGPTTQPVYAPKVGDESVEHFYYQSWTAGQPIPTGLGADMGTRLRRVLNLYNSSDECTRKEYEEQGGVGSSYYKNCLNTQPCCTRSWQGVLAGDKTSGTVNGLFKVSQDATYKVCALKIGSIWRVTETKIYSLAGIPNEEISMKKIETKCEVNTDLSFHTSGQPCSQSGFSYVASSLIERSTSITENYQQGLLSTLSAYDGDVLSNFKREGLGSIAISYSNKSCVWLDQSRLSISAQYTVCSDGTTENINLVLSHADTIQANPTGSYNLDQTASNPDPAASIEAIRNPPFRHYANHIAIPGGTAMNSSCFMTVSQADSPPSGMSKGRRSGYFGCLQPLRQASAPQGETFQLSTLAPSFSCAPRP